MNAVPFLLMLHIDNEKMTPKVRRDTAREAYIYIFEITVEVQEMHLFFLSVQNRSHVIIGVALTVLFI